MLKRYYVYAPDKTGHPFLFSPYSQVSSFKNTVFSHGIVDCGYNILMKKKEYSKGFFEEYIELIGSLRELYGKEKMWYVPPDYPCERKILGFKESIKERIDKTIENTIYFCDLGLDVKWLIPLQGWKLTDYLYCINQYKENKIDLTQVGIGTVCKRKKRKPITIILNGIKKELNSSWIHAFGLTKKYLFNVFFSIDSFDTASYTLGRFKYLNKSERPERWNYPNFLFNEWKKDIDTLINTLSVQSQLKMYYEDKEK